MEKIITFIAHDKEVFTDEDECARHEIYNCPGILEKLEKTVANEPTSHQKNWCNSMACACMGCINSAFHKVDLNKAHWKIWNEELRQEKPFGTEPDWDKSRDYDTCQIIIKEPGHNRKEVIIKIKQITGLGSIKAQSLLEGKNIVKDGYYRDAKIYKKQLEDLGATIEFVNPGKKIKIKP